MSQPSASAAAIAAAPVRAAADPAAAIVAAAQLLLPHLESGRRIDAAMLRAAMSAAFGASDSEGACSTMGDMHHRTRSLSRLVTQRCGRESATSATAT
jgi:hypothetical protein